MNECCKYICEQETIGLLPASTPLLIFFAMLVVVVGAAWAAYITFKTPRMMQNGRSN